MYCNSTLFPGDEEYIGLYTVFPGRETAQICRIRHCSDEERFTGTVRPDTHTPRMTAGGRQNQHFAI